MRITAKGQVTIPEHIRRQEGLLPGTEVEFVRDAKGVRIAPAGAGRRIYGGLAALFALAGAGIALRHSWLQWFPPDSKRCVGSDIEAMLNNFPLFEALPKIFGGSGECSTVGWTFLHLSIPEWGMVWFLVFAAVGLLALVRPGWFKSRA